MLVAIVGAGWSGCHLALQLTKEGKQVILLDRQDRVFGGTSGAFGIRLHRGPHYPRSKATRENCQNTFYRFREAYNELVIDHEYSIYANGTIDSDGMPSKVSNDAFEKVCMETPGCRKVDPASFGYAEMGCAYDLEEPSVAVGARARGFFEKALAAAGVSVVLGVNVLNVEPHYISTARVPKSAITFELSSSNNSKGPIRFPNVVYADATINCTGFQNLIPQEIQAPQTPLHFQFVYQVCLALKFRDNAPTSNKPMSFITMDGWFPCLMPAISEELPEGTPQRNYILTHGAYTILASFDTPEKAHKLLNHELDDAAIQEHIRVPAEREMKRFWPGFSDRFSYEGWYGSVLAKPRCPTEFRSSFTFAHKGMIHVFPGKVSNVFDASDEVSLLLQDQVAECPDVVSAGDYKYVSHGVFGHGQTELQAKVGAHDRSTSTLQTFSSFAKQTPSVIAAPGPISMAAPAPIAIAV